MNDILDSNENDNSHFNGTVFNKYALILIAVALVRWFSSPLVSYVADYFGLPISNMYMSIYGFDIVFNLIIAIVLHGDMTKLGWVSWPIIILTVLSSSIGLCLALGFFLYKKNAPARDQ